MYIPPSPSWYHFFYLRSLGTRSEFRTNSHADICMYVCMYVSVSYKDCSRPFPSNWLIQQTFPATHSLYCPTKADCIDYEQTFTKKCIGLKACPKTLLPHSTYVGYYSGKQHCGKPMNTSEI